MNLNQTGITTLLYSDILIDFMFSFQLQLTVHIQNLPDFDKQTFQFQCRFTPEPSAPISGSHAPIHVVRDPRLSATKPFELTTRANRTSQGIQCYTPESDRLPPLPSGEAITVCLSFYYISFIVFFIMMIKSLYFSSSHCSIVLSFSRHLHQLFLLLAFSLYVS